MLATILYIVLLFCTFGGSAFNMGNFRMQITVIRYCNLDLVDADGQPLNCHISNSMETMGLVLPGMDDGKSFTTRQDIFITKDCIIMKSIRSQHLYNSSVILISI
mmetsp:Transcript_7373/g.6137  ORF Transcript_7373/g.6137 Transcript_7373/m.6137 type:complete len:105 (+) Transcript_7373:65-379(+)